MPAHTRRVSTVAAGRARTGSAAPGNRARGPSGRVHRSAGSNSGRSDHAAVFARILLVDDDALNREVGQRTLALLGHSADTADSGAQALEMIEQRAYEIVMLDYHMPGMDGYETAARIRDLECRLARAPARMIAVTAAAGIKPAADPRSAAFDDFLWKPFRVEALKSLIERWLV